MESIVKVEHLSHRYTVDWAIQDINFEVNRKGILGLLGSNGAGKSTTMNIICGVLNQTDGTVYINGIDTRKNPVEAKKNIGFLPQKPPLYSDHTVDEYLEFQYGKDWTTPKQTVIYSNNLFVRYRYWMKTWIQDHLPDDLYYKWILNHRKKDFKKFKMQCVKAGIPLPLNVQLASMQPRKYRKVMTVGVYDLLHKGHVELYRRAKGLGDYLIVAAQDGDFILKYKPTAQVMNSTEDRKYMIKAIRYVDEVITYTDVDKIVQEVDFDVFVTGPDQIHAGFQRAIQWCEEHGKEHIVLGRTDGISSSELKAKIAAKTKK